MLFIVLFTDGSRCVITFSLVRSGNWYLFLKIFKHLILNKILFERFEKITLKNTYFSENDAKLRTTH